MIYRFIKDYTDRVSCVVEADSLEEAKEKAKYTNWENEPGDDFVVLYLGSIALNPEDDKPIESLEIIEEGEQEEDYYWDDIDDKDFFNKIK